MLESTFENSFILVYWIRMCLHNISRRGLANVLCYCGFIDFVGWEFFFVRLVKLCDCLRVYATFAIFSNIGNILHMRIVVWIDSLSENWCIFFEISEEKFEFSEFWMRSFWVPWNDRWILVPCLKFSRSFMDCIIIPPSE